MNISYTQFNPTANPELLPQLIRCYQDVFSTTPWSEWKTCKACKKKWGIEQWREIPTLCCPNCSATLENYWPCEVVEQDILKELSMPSATCWLALDGCDVVGFCWGYALTPQELDAKLGVACGCAQERVAYQDEIGVAMPYRGKHIAKKLFTLRLHDFLSESLSLGVVRTKTNPPSVTNLWFERLGYEIIARYNDVDGRVVMAKGLAHVLFEVEPELRPRETVAPNECSR